VVGVDHGEKKKKVCRGERKEFVVAVLLPVRIWVRKEAEQPSVGEGERFQWGFQVLKKQRGERKRREKCWLEKTRE
jgi:hypothetical protein